MYGFLSQLTSNISVHQAVEDGQGSYRWRGWVWRLVDCFLLVHLLAHFFLPRVDLPTLKSCRGVLVSLDDGLKRLWTWALDGMEVWLLVSALKIEMAFGLGIGETKS